MQGLRLLDLPGLYFVALGGVAAQGHQFEVGNDVIQLRTDGTGHDVVHAQLVAPIGLAPLDGGRLTFAHVSEPRLVQAAVAGGDLQVAQEAGAGELGGQDIGIAGARHGRGDEVGDIDALLLRGGQPVHGFLQARIGAAFSQGGELLWIDEGGDVGGISGDRRSPDVWRKAKQQEAEEQAAKNPVSWKHPADERHPWRHIVPKYIGGSSRDNKRFCQPDPPQKQGTSP